ncbi:type 1 fimbrial protein [Enterobacter roggenkampii]|uniref:type 1 fimbrial protein n=1 Tax=Enterobacter roggenkampii TaxID=1812935 RepID=UPI000DA2456B|nr:type 1 fimbrial protein [Enterobacter roggenkampii]
MIFYKSFFVLSSEISFPLDVVLATTEDHGLVSMQGEIIDSACDIEIDSREQYVGIGAIP